MEGLMTQTNSRTAVNNSKTYRYQDNQIEVLPYFLYEVDLYSISPKRTKILLSRYYTSDKFLNVKEVEVVKRFKNFNIQRFITLLGAPISFIEENNLPIYELKKSYKKKKS